ncbi:hypothetical protein PC118_g18439 [Phytophthora cactorum]|uniref:Uncharacterized protein n=1 Tax=Phytophthora cactorum TaxID=29920 RepID=A0A8T1F3T3_9STRA|nr:hypothetical protein PC118_g18439 [Phytophthora cactorum]
MPFVQQESAAERADELVPLIFPEPNINDEDMASMGIQECCQKYPARSSLNACTTKNVVFGPAGFDKATDATTFSKISYKFQNDDLLLDTFRHTFKDGQASDDAFAAADGTYKLHHGKWTVVAFGTFRTRFTLDRAYRKKFLPWAFPLVRKEHEYAYARLFRTVAKYTQEFWRSTHGQKCHERRGLLKDNTCYDKHRAANYKLHFEPIISSDTISTHRAHFHFDCTSFMNTDWLCSPVLATMSLRNQFDSGEVE